MGVYRPPDALAPYLCIGPLLRSDLSTLLSAADMPPRAISAGVLFGSGSIASSGPRAAHFSCASIPLSGPSELCTIGSLDLGGPLPEGRSSPTTARHASGAQPRPRDREPWPSSAEDRCGGTRYFRGHVDDRHDHQKRNILLGRSSNCRSNRKVASPAVLLGRGSPASHTTFVACAVRGALISDCNLNHISVQCFIPLGSPRMSIAFRSAAVGRRMRSRDFHELSVQLSKIGIRCGLRATRCDGKPGSGLFQREQAPRDRDIVSCRHAACRIANAKWGPASLDKPQSTAVR